ncbi:N-acetylneuraminate synthase family protein [Magnetospirillum sp. 15-1]|uniref:N-acetylneuraminate synthase family protein n=1 Tax=Magnetospirillum sp. 15-1 TaxID=1979370 RepID=UPI000BBBCEAC|nr:N-acetylneuraminate synthase family protein [Magnetospirillum sp. 15-1]
MKIGPIDLDRDVLIVAEIGNNHEGDMALAEEMIAQAAQAGAHAVKFQSIIPAHLVAPDQPARLAQLGRYQLSAENHVRLAQVARDNAIMFMSSPFSLDAVDLLAPLVPAMKVASGDNDHVVLLDRIAATGLPVILSTGMTDLDGAAFSAGTLCRAWAKAGIADPGLVLLHCVSSYPTPADQANLRAIRTLAGLGHVVGYSDHTLGIEAAVLSVALGARVIEKHFTLSKTQSEFRDHQLSAEPHELKALVERVAEANALLGDGVKRVMPGEEATAQAARRSLCAAADLPAGTVLGLGDLAWLRPAGGMAPGAEWRILGRRLTRPVAAGDRLALDMFEQ